MGPTPSSLTVILTKQLFRVEFTGSTSSTTTPPPSASCISLCSKQSPSSGQSLARHPAVNRSWTQVLRDVAPGGERGGHDGPEAGALLAAGLEGGGPGAHSNHLGVHSYRLQVGGWVNILCTALQLGSEIWS